MKKYKVNVNGNLYEVTLELVDESSISTTAAPAQKKEDTKPAPQSNAAAPTGNGLKITSPMPGTILSVNVSAGSSVKKGDVLMVLEAMKMENEIVCPQDGRVTSVGVSKGSSVETGALLCTIE